MNIENSRAPIGAPKLPEIHTSDADLQALIQAWLSLPEHIRQSITALVKAGGV